MLDFFFVSSTIENITDKQKNILDSWRRFFFRVFHLHHWFESLSNTCFQGCYVNRCIHVGVPTVWPVPINKHWVICMHSKKWKKGIKLPIGVQWNLVFCSYLLPSIWIWFCISPDGNERDALICIHHVLVSSLL